MTVSVAPRYQNFNGSGITGPFTFNFPIVLADDGTPKIVVTKIDSSGVQTVLNTPADYTFSAISLGLGGGSVTTTMAIAVGERLFIEASTPLDQTVKYSNQGDFFPETHERSYDKIHYILQENVYSSGTAIRIPSTDVTGTNTVLPNAAIRAGQAIVFDGSGNVGVGSVPTVTIPSYSGQAYKHLRVNAAGTAYELSDAGQFNGGLVVNGGRTIPATLGGSVLSSNGINNDFISQGRAAAVPGGWAAVRVLTAASLEGLVITGDTSQAQVLFACRNAAGGTMAAITQDGKMAVGAARVLQYNTNAAADVSSLYPIQLRSGTANTCMLSLGENNTVAYITGATFNTGSKFIANGGIIFGNIGNTAGSESGYVSIQTKPSGGQWYGNTIARFEEANALFYRSTITSLNQNGITYDRIDNQNAGSAAAAATQWNVNGAGWHIGVRGSGYASYQNYLHIGVNGINNDPQIAFSSSGQGLIFGASGMRLFLKSTGVDSDCYVQYENDARTWNVGMTTADEFNIYDNTAAAYRYIIDTSATHKFNTTTSLAFGSTTADGVNILSGQIRCANSGNDAAQFQRNGGDGNIVGFYRGTKVVGTISVTTTNTAYNTSSDPRLKVWADMKWPALYTLSQLKVHSGYFKAEPEKKILLMLADEIQAAMPEAVTGEKDAVDENGDPIWMQVDYSKMVPLLVASCKELAEEIENLKAEIKSLKGN